VVETHAEGARDGGEVAHAGLALAVLEHAHLARGAPDRGTEIVECHALRGARAADALADRQRVEIVERTRSRVVHRASVPHSFHISEERRKFCLDLVRRTW